MRTVRFRIGALAVFGVMAFGLVSCRWVMPIPDGPSGEPGVCGDNERQAGEECDGMDLGGKTCEDLGFGPGELVCNLTCDGFLTQACGGPSTCGNGVVDTGNGEVCDGTNLGGQGCEDLGYYPGTLACASNCRSFDTSGCGGKCGDGVKQENEACDGGDLGGETCRNLGYFTGTLSCRPDCQNVDDAGCANVEMLAAGDFHTCAVLTDGSVCCWGMNLGGQLGDGTTQNRLSPTPVLLPRPALHVAAGNDHTCAVLDDESLWCWGSNDYGQLGDGTTVASSVPVQVHDLTGVEQVAAGMRFTCALASGIVYCWGNNGHGQLGDGTDSNSFAPVLVSVMAVQQISAGWSHACAVGASGLGGVWCWGNNGSGQLGDGSMQDRHTPVPVANLSEVTWVEAGSFHTCALLSDGRVRCWGDNRYGQIGDGTTTPRLYSTAIAVSTSYLAVDVTAGDMHSCLVMTDGSAYCWGNNDYAQLGDGTWQGHGVPAVVSGSNGLVNIVSGYYHTCARNQIGRVWCWGENGSGQLGDGTTQAKTLPVEVLP